MLQNMDPNTSDAPTTTPVAAFDYDEAFIIRQFRSLWPALERQGFAQSHVDPKKCMVLQARLWDAVNEHTGKRLADIFPTEPHKTDPDKRIVDHDLVAEYQSITKLFQHSEAANLFMNKQAKTLQEVIAQQNATDLNRDIQAMIDKRVEQNKSNKASKRRSNTDKQAIKKRIPTPHQTSVDSSSSANFDQKTFIIVLKVPPVFLQTLIQNSQLIEFMAPTTCNETKRKAIADSSARNQQLSLVNQFHSTNATQPQVTVSSDTNYYRSKGILGWQSSTVLNMGAERFKGYLEQHRHANANNFLETVRELDKQLYNTMASHQEWNKQLTEDKTARNAAMSPHNPTATWVKPMPIAQEQNEPIPAI